MTDWVLHQGDRPLVISLPHTGTEVPAPVLAQGIDADLAVIDTDWRVDQLYDFARTLGATLVRTPYSRSVIDVNRDPSGASLYPGQATTGLVPTTSFDGARLYRDADPATEEVAWRRQAFFDPYHAALGAEIDRLRHRHGRVVVYDAHSIRSVVPRLFEGTLPVFNIGTFGGASADPVLAERVGTACLATGESVVLNGRFQGGWITRHYGRPSHGVHAVQMELAQRLYMNEADVADPASDRFARAEAMLRQVITAILGWVDVDRD
jgi:formiminoglutamase